MENGNKLIIFMFCRQITVVPKLFEYPTINMKTQKYFFK